MRCNASTFGDFLIFILSGTSHQNQLRRHDCLCLWETYLFSASCSEQHLSQLYLFLLHNISEAENCFKQAVTLVFCSMSILKSKKASSREVTVSHVKQRVSEVKMPEKRPCTQDSDDAEEGRGLAVTMLPEVTLSVPLSVAAEDVPIHWPNQRINVRSSKGVTYDSFRQYRLLAY